MGLRRDIAFVMPFGSTAIPRCVYAVLVAVCSALSMLAFTSSAEAAFPGGNGKLLFLDASGESNGIVTMNPDGTDRELIFAQNTSSNESPQWSPDGSKIAFAWDDPDPDLRLGIYVMNADGSGLRRVSPPMQGYGCASNPAWSPNGAQFAFEFFPWDSVYETCVTSGREIHVMSAAGGEGTKIADGAEPAWSPDGSKIAFSDFAGLRVMNPDGSGKTTLTGTPAYQKSWSPDGNRLVFSVYGPGPNSNLYTINADGTGQTYIGPGNSPAWSPDGNLIVREYNFNLDLLNPDGSWAGYAGQGVLPDWQPDVPGGGGGGGSGLPTGPPSSSEMYGGCNPAEVCNTSQGQAADPVNTADGNYFQTYRDLNVPGRGFPLNLTRTYNSLAARVNGPFGYGWSSSYGMHLSIDTETGRVTVSQENGSQVIFGSDGNGGFAAAPRVMATLVRNADDSWTFTRRKREKFKFDSGGRLVAQTDLNNYTTTIAYPNATTMTITDPSDRKLTLTLSGGRVIRAADSATPQRTVSYDYDGTGNLIEVTDVGGGHTHFTYDDKHRLLTARAPKYATDTTTDPPPVLTNEYSSFGRIISQTDQLGRETTFNYTYVPGATMVTDPKGNVTVDRYAGRRLVSRTRGYGTNDEAKWTYEYDPDTYGLTKACDPNQHCTTASFDSRGNLIRQTDPLDRTTQFTYDALNNLTSVTDPRGVKATMTYDGNGNLLSGERPLLDGNGQTVATQKTTYNYGGTTPNYAGDVTSIVDPRGKTWQYRYDAHGNQISVTAPPTPENPSGNKITYAYNTGTGWRTSETNPKGNVSGGNPAAHTTTYTYDPFGRVTQVRDPLWSSSSPSQHQQTLHYDANGNLDYTIDGNNRKTDYVYNPANELVEIGRADGTRVTHDYWDDGTLRRRYDGKNNRTTYDYDALGRTTEVTDPLGRPTELLYDAAGNLRTRISPRGEASYTYDAANQLTGIDYGDMTPDVTSISYDANGQRTGMTDGTGTSVWTWDSLGRLTSSKDGYNNTVGYGYDMAGNMTSLTYPGNLTVTRSFDAAGRMDWLQDWKGNKTTFGYDANSNLTTTTRPAANGVIDSVAYDNSNRPLSISSKKGTATRAAFTYTRDGAGQVATSTTTGITEAAQSYTYTPLEQLKTSGPAGTPINYAYDAADNLTRRGNSSTLAYDAANQLCWQQGATVANPSCGSPPTGATRFSYDADGNRTTRTPSSGAPTTYTYDQENRLTRHNTTAGYAYDGNGLRLSKTVSGSTKHQIWDRASGLPQLLSDGTNNYIYGPDGLPLEQMNSAGTTVTFLHHDQLGSTRLLTNTSGTNVASYTYDAYGKQTAKTGTATTPLGYAGQYTDSESGLIYMRARYYDPETGAFITRDPLEDRTRQPYAYAGNDPVNSTDPTGLSNVGTAFEAVFGDGGYVDDVAPDPLSDFSAGLLNELTLGGAAKAFDVNPNCFGFAGSLGEQASEYVPGPSGWLRAPARLLRFARGAARGAKGAERALSQPGRRRLGKQRAGVPRSSSPVAQGGSSRTGRWWEYDDVNGQRKIVVEHPDGTVHAGIPKPQSTHRTGGPPKYYDYGGFGHVGE